MAAVIPNARSMVIKPPPRPAFPITHPSRRYMITPRMVNRVGVNTPANVPYPGFVSFGIVSLCAARLVTAAGLSEPSRPGPGP